MIGGVGEGCASGNKLNYMQQVGFAILWLEASKQGELAAAASAQ